MRRHSSRLKQPERFCCNSKIAPVCEATVAVLDTHIRSFEQFFLLVLKQPGFTRQNKSRPYICVRAPHVSQSPQICQGIFPSPRGLCNPRTQNFQPHAAIVSFPVVILPFYFAAFLLLLVHAIPDYHCQYRQLTLPPFIKWLFFLRKRHGRFTVLRCVISQPASDLCSGNQTALKRVHGKENMIKR